MSAKPGPNDTLWAPFTGGPDDPPAWWAGFWSTVIAFIPFTEGDGAPRIWKRQTSDFYFTPEALEVVGSPTWEWHPTLGLGMRFNNANPDYLSWPYPGQPDLIAGKSDTQFGVIFVGELESGPTEHVIMSRPDTGLELLKVTGAAAVTIPPDDYAGTTPVPGGEPVVFGSFWDRSEEKVGVFAGDSVEGLTTRLDSEPLPLDSDGLGGTGEQRFFAREPAVDDSSFKGFISLLYILKSSNGIESEPEGYNEIGEYHPPTPLWAIANEPLGPFSSKSAASSGGGGSSSGGVVGGGFDGSGASPTVITIPTQPLSEVVAKLREFPLGPLVSDDDRNIAIRRLSESHNELVRVTNTMIEKLKV